MSLSRSASGFSQSSKKSSIVTVSGCTPPNSGAVEDLAFLLVGRFHIADLLVEYSLGLKRNLSSCAPFTSMRLALVLPTAQLSSFRNPLCASSNTSVAIWLPAASSEGPVHFTG